MSKEEITLYDALGKEVEVGASYGYSYFSGGLATTAVGSIEATKGKYAELKVTCRTHFLDGEIIERKWVDRAPMIVHIAPHVLFPVDKS